MTAHDSAAPDGCGIDALHDHVVASMTLPETMDWIATLAVREVSGADFGVVLVPGQTRRSPETLAATDPVASGLVQVERSANSGPLLSTLATGTVNHLEQTTDLEGPWPEFRAASVQQGVLSVLAMPLEAAGSRIGALALYAEAAHAFPALRVAVATEFASAAAVVLTNAANYWASSSLNEQLAAALESRAVIDQAKGILMHTMLCGADEAFGLLVAQSKSENRKLREIAAELVAKRAGGPPPRLQQPAVDRGARR